MRLNSVSLFRHKIYVQICDSRNSHVASSRVLQVKFSYRRGKALQRVELLALNLGYFDNFHSNLKPEFGHVIPDPPIWIQSILLMHNEYCVKATKSCYSSVKCTSAICIFCSYSAKRRSKQEVLKLI